MALELINSGKTLFLIVKIKQFLIYKIYNYKLLNKIPIKMLKFAIEADDKMSKH